MAFSEPTSDRPVQRGSTEVGLGVDQDDGRRTDSQGPASAADFARQAEQAQPGIVAEFWDFFLNNKKWWITPIIAVLLLMGLLLLLSGSSAAPFIYTIW